MLNITQSLEYVAVWVRSQLNTALVQGDITTGQRLVILGSLCLEHARGHSQELFDLLCTAGASIQGGFDTQSLSDNITYALVITGLGQPLPQDLQTQISRYSIILLDNNFRLTDAQLLPAVLLLQRLHTQNRSIAAHLTNIPPTIPATNLLRSGRQELLSFSTQVNACARYGEILYTDLTPAQVAVLEVRLLSATRAYDLEVTAALLRTLTYVKGISSLISQQVIRFLLVNQASEGFFGYYDREFQLMIKEGLTVPKLDYLVSTTSFIVTALLEATSKFRFCRDIGRINLR